MPIQDSTADDRPAVVELRPGELSAMVARHDAIADPVAREADWVWWNWSRMRAGVSVGDGDPEEVAVMPWVVPRLAELLERDLVSQPAPTGGREALRRALETSGPPPRRATASA